MSAKRIIGIKWIITCSTLIILLLLDVFIFQVGILMIIGIFVYFIVSAFTDELTIWKESSINDLFTPNKKAKLYEDDMTLNYKDLTITFRALYYQPYSQKEKDQFTTTKIDIVNSKRIVKQYNKVKRKCRK